MKLANLLETLENIELSSTSVIVAIIALIVVTILMLREFMTWMVKTNRVRQDIHDLSIQIQNLEERLKMQERPSTLIKSADGLPENFSFPLEIKSETTNNL